MSLHIEKPPLPGTIMLIGFRPALCGRHKSTDYRMLPPNDEHHKQQRVQCVAGKAGKKGKS